MEQDLGRAQARAIRNGRPFAVALFDIDHFKLYNDHYGHLAGDEALRRVANCFDSTTRAGESTYRYGGEEFLVLMVDCDLDGAVAAAERIRRSVSEAAVPHDARPTQPPLVTLSGGVASWAQMSTASMDDLLGRADEALFAAKAAGRNRVHVAPTSCHEELHDAPLAG
jgi:diguanylate cyclase (GGDEF)-like protein